MHGDDLPVRAGSGLIDQYSCAARIDIEGIPQWSRRLQRLLFRLHLSVFGHIFYFLIMFIIVFCDLIYALPEFYSVVSPEIYTALRRGERNVAQRISQGAPQSAGTAPQDSTRGSDNH
jgi:hypothetical protein